MKKIKRIKTLYQYFKVRGLRKRKKFEFKYDKPECLTEAQWESLAGAWQSWFFTDLQEHNPGDDERHPLSIFASGVQYGYQCADPEFIKKQFDHVKK